MDFYALGTRTVTVRLLGLITANRSNIHAYRGGIHDKYVITVELAQPKYVHMKRIICLPCLTESNALRGERGRTSAHVSERLRDDNIALRGKNIC